MKIKTLVRFLWKTPLALLFRILGTTNHFYRATFLSAALSSGLLAELNKGPASADVIGSRLGIDSDIEALTAWLDLGTSLGELEKEGGAYRPKSGLAKRLSDPKNEAYAAYFRVRVDVFYDYILRTPGLLKDGKRLPAKDSYAELYAKSSRTVEPIIMELIEDLIPRNSPCRLLEVGCGSGVYIRRACELNPQLTAVGLESQTGAADFARRNIKEWGLDNRSVIQEADIRSFNSEESFDLATMHNLIYYFPFHEREALFTHVRGLLTDSGRLVMTTLTKGSDPSTQVMDLWAHMTEGYGSLPVPDRLWQQLIDAGYRDVQAQKILGDFYLFTAEVAQCGTE